MSLSGLHADGEVIRTSSGSSRPKDPEVAYRAALREFMRTGQPFAAAEAQLVRAGTPAGEVSRIKAEEASSFFRMSRDTFSRSSQTHDQLAALPRERRTPAVESRMTSLRQDAGVAFTGASRANGLLGALDPVRNRELASMENWLLASGFPKDELSLSDEIR